jgi:hypothetical protein
MNDDEHMTLGQLQAILQQYPREYAVSFPLGVPARLCSYRGYYEQLAIVAEDGHRTVAELLAEVNEALAGKRFDGYKGGSYRMTEKTPIWVVLRYKGTSQCTIGEVRIDHGNETLWLMTKWCEW